MKKLTYRQSYRLMYVFLGAALLLGLPAALFEFKPLMYAGIAAALAGILQTAIFCRCPHCGESLNIRGGLPNYCPDCGEKLDEEE